MVKNILKKCLIKCIKLKNTIEKSNGIVEKKNIETKQFKKLIKKNCLTL